MVEKLLGGYTQLLQPHKGGQQTVGQKHIKGDMIIFTNIQVEDFYTESTDWKTDRQTEIFIGFRIDAKIEI